MNDSRTVYVVARSKKQSVRFLMGDGDVGFGTKTFVHKSAANLEVIDLGRCYDGATEFRVFPVTINIEVGEPLALPRERRSP